MHDRLVSTSISQSFLPLFLSIVSKNRSNQNKLPIEFSDKKNLQLTVSRHPSSPFYFVEMEMLPTRRISSPPSFRS